MSMYVFCLYENGKVSLKDEMKLCNTTKIPDSNTIDYIGHIHYLHTAIASCLIPVVLIDNIRVITATKE